MAKTYTVYNASGLPVEVEDAERADALAARYGWSKDAPADEPADDAPADKPAPKAPAKKEG